jgi:hypothetical protein
LNKIFKTMGLAAFLLLAGCSGAKSPTPSSPVPEGQPAATSPFAPPITVIRPDGTSVTVTYETVAGLPPQTLEVGGKSEHGPILADFLAAAGVTEFSQATFFGLENRALAFTRDQLTDEYILALRSKARAVNLVSPKLAEDQWVLHVFRVEVK